MYRILKDLIVSPGFGIYSLAFGSVIGVFFYTCGEMI